MRRADRLIGIITAVGLLLAPALRAQGNPRGHLFIVGGGSQSDTLVHRFIELAGGSGKARIAVIPLASAEAAETGEEKAVQLRGFGATAVVWLPTREDASNPAWIKRVDSVTGIWFTGGDQARVTAVLSGTPMAAALRNRYRAGAVVGGTSAGAAIMPDSMITGNQRTADSLGYYGDSYPGITAGTIEIVPGLGFLPGAIVDQHFLKRERHNRLLSAVLERRTMIGVGIDEGTALEVGPHHRWSVLGAGSVVIYDARKARVVSTAKSKLLGAGGIALHVLPPGSIYDPKLGVIRVGAP